MKDDDNNLVSNPEQIVNNFENNFKRQLNKINVD